MRDSSLDGPVVVVADARGHDDCALLDITMPDLDGMELLRIIKEESPRTECVMLQGSARTRAAPPRARGVLARAILELVPSYREAWLEKATTR